MKCSILFLILASFIVTFAINAKSKQHSLSRQDEAFNKKIMDDLYQMISFVLEPNDTSSTANVLLKKKKKDNPNDESVRKCLLLLKVLKAQINSLKRLLKIKIKKEKKKKSFTCEKVLKSLKDQLRKLRLAWHKKRKQDKKKKKKKKKNKKESKKKKKQFRFVLIGLVLHCSIPGSSDCDLADHHPLPQCWKQQRQFQ